eukprot:TRINITY_DN11176_c0_g1_i1.p1 TRINITY_DN11176_c0_g1~~TRINITY_DN11176_c0_g1_i1.p1  ORF type:complete len:252 (-),score=35.75 TRINITY_DN11176_c0_g1_i1:179-934(-)
MTKGHLTDHVRRHRNERPFVCSYCGAAFVRGCALKVHVRRHTGEKPYTCPECGKSFTEKGNMNMHMKIHGSVKSEQKKKQRNVHDKAKDEEMKIPETLHKRFSFDEKGLEEDKNLLVTSQDLPPYIPETLQLDDPPLIDSEMNRFPLSSYYTPYPSSPTPFDLRPEYTTETKAFVPYKPPAKSMSVHNIIWNDLKGRREPFRNRIDFEGIAREILFSKNVLPHFTIAAYLCTDASSQEQEASTKRTEPNQN